MVARRARSSCAPGALGWGWRSFRQARSVPVPRHFPVVAPIPITLDVNHATRYYCAVSIKSFKCKDTEALFQGKRVRRWVNVERPALRKLEQLDWSAVLEDLRVPPGNQLEALKGNRKGQHSIRVNDQWRVCFVWTPLGPKDVEIVDYH